MPKILVIMSLLLTCTVCLASEPPQDVKAPVAATDKKQSKTLPIKAPLMAKEDATEVKVIVEKKRTIKEYRHRGELIMVKVIPNKGKPYYIDPLENRQQGTAKELMDAGVKPVHWVIKEF